jgi:hypothetical protein
MLAIHRDHWQTHLRCPLLEVAQGDGQLNVGRLLVLGGSSKAPTKTL